MTWLCAQIGAREHYAIPRALNQQARLDKLYTDFWATAAVRRFPFSAFPMFGSLAARFHPALAQARVDSWNVRSMFWESALRQASKQGGSRGLFHGFVNVGHKFAGAVRDSLRPRRNLPRDAVLFAYDTGALEAFEWAREHGIRCVLNQMDPNRVEVDLVREEATRWPGWELRPLEVPEEYFQRREREWALADRIVVNSEFCQNALVKQGVPPEKLFVLPLCYEPEERGRNVVSKQPASDPSRFQLSAFGSSASSPLRVLFLGQVILRKGIQYLIEAARKLENENIRFDVVGPVGLSADAVATVQKNMKFHGQANRTATTDWYQQADVFVLPTLSDAVVVVANDLPTSQHPAWNTVCDG